MTYGNGVAVRRNDFGVDMRSIGIAACFAAVAVLAAQPLAAQSDPADAIDTPEVIDKLFQCRAIADPDARLSCFDREVADVYEAQQSRDLHRLS